MGQPRPLDTGSQRVAVSNKVKQAPGLPGWCNRRVDAAGQESWVGRVRREMVGRNKPATGCVQVEFANWHGLPRLCVKALHVQGHCPGGTLYFPERGDLHNCWIGCGAGVQAGAPVS